jgi:ribonucleoside-diphosphate reductase alpha chain
MARDRGVAVTVPGTMTLDWDELRSTVKNGMRNATLLAVAPTASIGLVAGTTPGIDPQFSQIFSRATSSGKFLEMNVNLVQALKKLGLWEALRDTILERQGDISELTVIPESVRCVYRTSFQLPPSVFITIAARAQKWVDQAISRNMYLESRDVTEMMKVYLEAWEQGLKTTYYLHMKPRHSAEQSTIRVNKAESVLGGSGVGFGFAAASPPPVAVPAGPLVCPVDPAELAACEACQ